MSRAVHRQELAMTDLKLSLEAPAKINIFLRITGRRANGYHDLQSLMIKLLLGDEIHLQRCGSGIELSCPGTDLPVDASNLAYRAAQAFFDKTRVACGVKMVLKKHIPIAAGLGGGSSDAGAVLRGLDALCGTNLCAADLLALARPLGADVPFFVSDYDAAWATGVGDCLERADYKYDGWIVLVNPGFPVSTKWVYENFALTTGGNPYILGRNFERDKQPTLAGKKALPLFNDLESVTVERFPQIASIKRELIEGGATGALMSGSGPTVFGLFDEKEKAERCAASCAAARSGMRVFLTRPRPSL